MDYSNLDKLLNIILKHKYEWIDRIVIPYHYTLSNGTVIYYINVHLNKHIYDMGIDVPQDKYKMFIDDFEKATKTSFKKLKFDIDDLFHSQILSDRVSQEIWFFIPLKN
jgi:hypothetical protein